MENPRNNRPDPEGDLPQPPDPSTMKDRRCARPADICSRAPTPPPAPSGSGKRPRSRDEARSRSGGNAGGTHRQPHARSRAPRRTDTSRSCSSGDARGSGATSRTRRQRSTSHSTAEAEYFAASLAGRETVFVRDLLEDLGFGVTEPTPLFLDSKAAINLAEDPVAFKKTKHILRAAHDLRDRVARRVLAPRFVPTESQLADVLTKALRPGLHTAALDLLLYAAPSSGDVG